MSAGMPSQDQKRFRVGIVVLSAGLLLILWSWGNWVYRTSRPEQGAQRVRMHAADADALRAKARAFIPRLLVYSLIIILTVLFGSYVLVRASRRYREAADRTRAAPTAAPSVWEMHRVPDHERDGRDGEDDA